MNKIKRWIRNWLTSNENEQNYKLQAVASSCEPSTGLDTQQKYVTFTLNRAIGGAVIQSRVYDRTRDDIKTTLYIIQDDEEFTQAFSQIVSLEYMKI